MSEPRTKQREQEFAFFLKKTKGLAYIRRALTWFQQNLGKIVTAKELARIPGKDGDTINHNMRRVFELRDEAGYEIINWKDINPLGAKLKVDEWILLSPNPNPEKIRARGVNKRIAYEVFTRDGSQCQFCGRTPQDDDPFKAGHKIKLHVGHIIAHKRENGKEIVRVENIEDMDEDELLTKDDFITMCNVCNEGAKNKDLEILSHEQKVLKLSEEHQRKIYEELKKKFN
ncbi:MAG: hypothetical protein AABW89_05930 [Nanoarchaeota archaeon]